MAQALASAEDAPPDLRDVIAVANLMASYADDAPGLELALADLAAAAHLSAVDYLGDVPWNENEAAKNWYARVKSRPAFRPLLADTLAGLPAAKNYADLDF